MRKQEGVGGNLKKKIHNPHPPFLVLLEFDEETTENPLLSLTKLIDNPRPLGDSMASSNWSFAWNSGLE